MQLHNRSGHSPTIPKLSSDHSFSTFPAETKGVPCMPALNANIISHAPQQVCLFGQAVGDNSRCTSHESGRTVVKGAIFFDRKGVDLPFWIQLVSDVLTSNTVIVIGTEQAATR
mgnify:CR=1 FL=1